MGDSIDSMAATENPFTQQQSHIRSGAFASDGCLGYGRAVLHFRGSWCSGELAHGSAADVRAVHDKRLYARGVLLAMHSVQ